MAIASRSARGSSSVCHSGRAREASESPESIVNTIESIPAYCVIDSGFRPAAGPGMTVESLHARRQTRGAPIGGTQARAARRSTSSSISPRSKRWGCSSASTVRSTRTASCIPLVRWQFQGGLAEAQRRAFLFSNVVDAAGRRYDIPVVVGALAASPQIYAAGMGRPVEEIEAAWLHGISHPDSAGRRVVAGLPAGGDHRRRSARAGQGARGAAGAGLDTGLRRRALSHRDALRHARSRHRHPEHGHLSRPAQSHRPARRAHGVAHRRGGRLRALAQAQEARHADALRHRHRLRAGRDVHRRHEARDRSRRDGGGRRARRRADARRQGGDGRPHGAGRRRDRDRGPDRSGVCSSRRARSAKATATSRSKTSTCRCR